MCLCVIKILAKVYTFFLLMSGFFRFCIIFSLVSWINIYRHCMYLLTYVNYFINKKHLNKYRDILQDREVRIFMK